MLVCFRTARRFSYEKPRKTRVNLTFNGFQIMLLLLKLYCSRLSNSSVGSAFGMHLFDVTNAEEYGFAAQNHL